MALTSCEWGSSRSGGSRDRGRLHACTMTFAHAHALPALASSHSCCGCHRMSCTARVHCLLMCGGQPGRSQRVAALLAPTAPCRRGSPRTGPPRRAGTAVARRCGAPRPLAQ
eukprot:10041079-Alexandrium_andersonii.AAC.1